MEAQEPEADFIWGLKMSLVAGLKCKCKYVLKNVLEVKTTQLWLIFKTAYSRKSQEIFRS